MRSVIIFPFTAFVIGIALYYKLNYVVSGAAFAALFLMLYIKKAKSAAVFSVVFIAVGIFAACVTANTLDIRYKFLTKQNIFEGIVTQTDDNFYTVYNYKHKYKIKLSIYEKNNITPGDYIHFNGKLQNLPKYKIQLINTYGTDAWVNYTKGTLKINKSNNLLNLPYRIKYKITKALYKIDKNGGAFISGLICGYTADISQSSSENFKKLGISHILAVSGFNLVIIYTFINSILKTTSKRKKVMINLAVCLAYVFICGFEPSITRAYIMICIASVSSLTLKPYSVINSLIAAAFIMLASNTLYILNLGFILSFFATAGLVLFSGPISEKIPERFSAVRDNISVTLAAFISTLPLIMLFNGSFSLLTIAVNFIIAPLVSAVTILGFVSALIFAVFSFEAILYPVVFSGMILNAAANLFSKISIIIFTGKPAVLFIILYYAFMLVIFKYIVIKIKRKMKVILNTMVTILLFLILFYRGKEFMIHFINVGQGDCIFMETPSHETILVDTGPSFLDSIAVRDKVIPYINKLGYNKIDMLFITHFHNDHSGGLKYLLQNYKINYIFSFEIPADYKNFISRVSKGDIINADDVSIHILYPESSTYIEQEDQNETGLVMEVIYKDFNMLLTADAQKEVMDLLAGDYDVFKVPHHGSVYSLSEDLLSNSKIGTSIISVGKNSFGHPSEIVIKSLYKIGSKVYRTDIDGNITVKTNGEKYYLDTQAQ